MRIILLLTLVASLGGCMNPAATGPKFTGLMPSNQDSALIYFYRPLQDDGGTACLNILVNDLEKGCLGTKGYLGFQVEPGEYTIKIKPNVFPVHTLLEFKATFDVNDKRLYQYSIARSSKVPSDHMVSRYTVGGTVFIQELPFNFASRELSGLNQSVNP